MSAARFLWRWNARLLRREWRVHVAVLATVAVGTAVSVAGVVAAYNLAPPPERDYGEGQVVASVTGDAAGVRRALDAQSHPVGELRSAVVALPGSARTVEIRVHDPADPVGEPLLALLDGRWPAGPDEVAVTDGTARLLDVGLGDQVTLARHRTTVVGLVENPTRLGDEFVLAPELAPFGVAPRDVTTTFLVAAPPREVVFPSGLGTVPSTQERGQAESRTQAALAANAVAAVAMIEVTLLAAAGFVVVAARRSRQYGLLAAIGAPPSATGWLSTMSGIAVGAVAVPAGVAAGVASAAALVPRLETVVGHRIDITVPWLAVLPVVVMATTAVGGAAWWPSRASRRRSVVAALASHRPQTPPVARTVAAGAAVALAGTATAVYGVVSAAVVATAAGVTGALVGLLLLSPAVVRLVGRAAGRLPLSARLAARSVGRHQARSAAVLAALVVALGLPVGLVVASATIDDRERRREDNLPDNMAVLWLPGAEETGPAVPVQLGAEAAAASLDRVTAAVPGARVAPVEVAVDPDSPVGPARFERLGMRPAVHPNHGLRPVTEPCHCDVVAYGDRDETGAELLFAPHDAWVANPALLDGLGIAASPDRPGLGLTRWDDAVLRSHRVPGDDPSASLRVHPGLPPFTSVASSLIWPETVAANGWQALTVGWIVVADEPLTPARLADLESAAGPDLLAEVRLEPSPQLGLRVAALLVGGLAGLGILVPVVSLHVAESARDRRTLRAIGASPRTGERLSAATGAVLAVGATPLAVLVGYLPLVAMTADRDLGFHFVVPWASLAGVVVAFPVLALGAGWLASRATTRAGSR